MLTTRSVHSKELGFRLKELVTRSVRLKELVVDRFAGGNTGLGFGVEALFAVGFRRVRNDPLNLHRPGRMLVRLFSAISVINFR